MTILYKVRNSSNSILQHRSFFNVSSKNIAAFSIVQDVFVSDITSPWKYFKVCLAKNVISALEWNDKGELLLIATKGGNVELWSARDYTLNFWELIYLAKFSNEDILNAKFFNNGRHFLFNSQKKDLSLYAEKFERLDHRPTLLDFGFSAAEGFIGITSSGQLGVSVISPRHNENSQCIELTPVFHRLNIQRAAFDCASICVNNDGTLTLAVYGKNCPHAIFCFKLTIKQNNNFATQQQHNNILATQQQRGLILNCEALPTVFTTSLNLQFIRNCIINNEDALFVTYQQADGGSILEQWNLTKKAQIVHKMLQKNKSDTAQQLECWENTAKMHFSSEIRHVCVSKLFADFIQISVILKDNIQCTVFEPAVKKFGTTPFERLIENRESQFVAADVTHMNQILFTIDNQGQIYAIQLPQFQLDKVYKPLSMQVSMLEYCIVTGIDATDILLLNPLNVEILVEKLTENFTRQHSYTRQFYYSNFLSLKRMLSKQQDFDNLIILHAISITFKSLLRPSDLNSQDKGPADNLSIILTEPISDVDKVLFNLDAKDFTVEPPTLQSLQQLIQWVSDLGLNILNRLPEEAMKPKLGKKQGYDISRDIAAMNSIRELLVMVRIWGLLNAQCLPIYTKSVENIDVLSIIFRLLTRLTQNPTEPDEILLDECSLLSSQVLMPARDPNSPATSLLSATKSFPLYFTVDVVPSILQELQFEEVVFTRGIKDGVTNLHLGSKAKQVRCCSRCGFINSQKNVKTSALKAWCNRWMYCVCGGFWKI